MLQAHPTKFNALWHVQPTYTQCTTVMRSRFIHQGPDFTLDSMSCMQMASSFSNPASELEKSCGDVMGLKRLEIVSTDQRTWLRISDKFDVIHRSLLLQSGA